VAQPERRKKIRAQTVITTHLNPDFDAVASMVAAAKLYPGAVMLFPGGQGRNIRSFFVQSLIYLFDVARPRELEYEHVERLVVVDTRQRDRLGAAEPCLNNPDLDVHVYDHHPDGPEDLKGSLQVVDQVGANVTLLIEILLAKNLTVSPQEATMLALGLYEDTGGFTFSSTTPRDMKAGAALLDWGADLSVVTQFTSRELTAEQLSLLNELILCAETREARGRNLVISMASRETHIEDVAVLAHKMMDILSADLLFVLVEMENMVQLVARSRLRDVDVGEIASAMGGGGHSFASAAAVRGKSLNEVRRQLETLLSEALGKLYSAGSIMAKPPISIPEDRSIADAMNMLVNYNLNVLLAENSAGQTCGIITDHNVNKAIYHGLEKYKVSQFMLTEFQTLPEDGAFSDVKRIIVDQGQRILPVTDASGSVTLGVITRTDLLRLMTSDVRGGPEEASRRGSSSIPYERNLLGIMEERLPGPILKLLRRLGDLAGEQELTLYLVGGTVRDLIMLKPVGDLDLSVGGDMKLLLQAIEQNMDCQKIKRHDRFKTATVVLADGCRLDLSNARVEYYERPGALPVVSQASIQLDLQRRDFTINALAISLNAEDFGRLFDYYRGFQDIKENMIRVLHSLSIIEDPTRAFRAARFAARLNFKISKMTQGLIDSAVRGGFLKKIKLRRILTELRHIFDENEVVQALEILDGLGLLPSIHPSIKLTPHLKELLRHVAKVRDWFALTTFGSDQTPVWLVFFLVLTENVPQPELEKLVAHLDANEKEAKILAAERSRLNWLLTRYKRKIGTPEPKPSEIDRLLSPLSWPAILYLMAKSDGEILDRAGAAYLAIYRRVTPICGGDDLLAMGVPRGPSLQKALSALREAKLDGEVPAVDDEKAFVRDYLAREAQAEQETKKIEEVAKIETVAKLEEAKKAEKTKKAEKVEKVEKAEEVEKVAKAEEVEKSKKIEKGKKN
jgi:tRNA nucleotidyltransferase (CCA-adding enzyme)